MNRHNIRSDHAARPRRAVVTGSCGLVGSAVCEALLQSGCTVIGVDADMRKVFFGDEGSTSGVRATLEKSAAYKHCASDVANLEKMSEIMSQMRPELVVHCAAQPSHDRAAAIPLLDAQTNVLGTLSVLESVKMHCPTAVFVHLSTNKVYGDNPNKLDLVELRTRLDYADGRCGIDESMSTSGGVHSLFGVSKLAAEAYVTEYGTNFGIKTCSLRGGCLTGAGHASVELHGFLSYIIKCAVTRKHYSVFGFGGKQVRDQLSAKDVAELIMALFAEPPAPGSAFNIGGGRANSASVLEIISALRDEHHLELEWELDSRTRTGDHACYITDNGAITRATGWQPKVPLQQIIAEIIRSFA